MSDMGSKPNPPVMARNSHRWDFTELGVGAERHVTSKGTERIYVTSLPFFSPQILSSLQLILYPKSFQVLSYIPDAILNINHRVGCSSVLICR